MATKAKLGIWQCVVSDGTASYFDNEPEADFYFKDTREAGFSVRQQFIPLPTTPRDFVIFMEGLEARLIRPARKLGEDSAFLFDPSA